MAHQRVCKQGRDDIKVKVYTKPPLCIFFHMTVTKILSSQQNLISHVLVGVTTAYLCETCKASRCKVHTCANCQSWTEVQ